MGRIAAVIFDMDGVLIEARDWHYEALNRALGHFGYEISRYDHLTTFDGLPTRMKLEMLTREQGLPKKLHGFLNELKQSYTLELVHTHCKPIFQHEFALAKLSAAKIKVAVASNSVMKSIELMMEKSALAPYLLAVLSNQDVTKPKPDPEIYVKAMKLLGVEPGETLILEDNPHGIKAARASGAHVMVVANPQEVTWDRIADHMARAEGASTPA
jgi:beta-phosphoglucomutase-like phosphatase (HAD superfamily)